MSSNKYKERLPALRKAWGYCTVPVKTDTGLCKDSDFHAQKIGL